MDRPKLATLVTFKPGKAREHSGNSTSDRLSSFYTVYILMGFAVFVQFSQIFGEPVQCWCPAHFTDTHSAYTNKVCWTSNTYYLPYNSQLNRQRDEREYVSYYQWVALVLTFQALAFMIPKFIWMGLSPLSGVAIYTITDAALECDKKTLQEDRDKALDYMVQHMDRFLSKLGKGCWGRLRGHFLPFSYLCTKLLYLVNIIAQLYILNLFLDTDYNMYGFSILYKMANGEPWLNSNRFPRVTLCDFSIRLLGNVHRYTVQCSLPMNLFNEIIYIFIWFWFVFVAAVTAGSALLWFINIIVPALNRRFVRKRLIAMNVLEDNGEKNNRDVARFVGRYLKGDGCFILRMVKKNASDLVASEIIKGLWTKWMKTRKTMQAQRSLSYTRRVDGNLHRRARSSQELQMLIHQGSLRHSSPEVDIDMNRTDLAYEPPFRHQH